MRDTLRPADRIEGPAIIEEAFATHVIARGWTATLHPEGAIIARRAP
jgi:N-methylhydantoinase A/oxoprolinase/acetone carboxylase beta subunit